MKQQKEVWLRGEPVDGIAEWLQPVAHALLQAGEEITNMMESFPDHLLWERPGGCAAPGFHLRHIPGVLDRLLTYAEAKPLSTEQLDNLKEETIADNSTVNELVQRCQTRITLTLERLKQFSGNKLLEHRGVGRAQLPSTVMGLCTHAAEHTMRHVGQLLVTVRVLQNTATGALSVNLGRQRSLKI